MTMSSSYATRRNALLRRIPAITYPTPTITAVSPSPLLGAGGTVTLTGTGFRVPDGSGGYLANVFDVRIGGALLTNLSIASDTSLTATYPAMAVGAVAVWINSFGGGAYSAATVGYDPAALALTGWWRASYGGSPWAGTASAGSSATPTLSSGAAPAVGAAVNGLTPTDFDGTNDNLAASVNTTSLFSAGAGALACLFNPDTAIAPAAEAYDDRPLATDVNGRIVLSHTTSGIRASVYNGAAWVKTASVAVGTGAWHWAFAWWDGTSLYCQLDDGSSVSVVVGGSGVTMGASVFQLGENYDTTKDYDGKILDLMTINATWSAQNIADLILYGNSRYALSL